MLFLCPKALSSNDGNSLERDFIKYYLSINNKKARITNEVWETFRYKILTNSSNKEGAISRITEYRGVFEPEIQKLKDDFEEVEAMKEYNTSEMRDSVISFLKRNWADIDIFITTEPQIYKEVCDEFGINLMTLPEFYLDCMDNEIGRNSLMSYWGKIQEEKWN